MGLKMTICILQQSFFIGKYIQKNGFWRQSVPRSTTSVRGHFGDATVMTTEARKAAMASKKKKKKVDTSNKEINKVQKASKKISGL